MKKCLICSHESNDATCPKCGEASWAEAPRGRRVETAVAVEKPAAEEPALESKPEHERVSKKSRKKSSGKSD